MIVASTITDQAANPLDGFVAVQLQILRATQPDAVDLFVQYEPHREPTLYCRAGNHPNEQQFAELAEAGVENLFVTSDDFRNFSNDLFASLKLILRQETLGKTEKFAALQVAVAVAIEQTLRLVDCSKFCTLAAKIGDDLVSMFGDGNVLPRELFRLARHDFNTFTHVTNVASYCVILAQKRGINNEAELRQIATGAILHDFGKRFIPPKILIKQGRHSTEEREIIQSHPARGYADLCGKREFEYGQLMMVYQHHERVDGTGYPVKVLQDEIHPWARMLAVVDVFDTLTAKRPNRRSATPEYVLDYQRQRAGTQFDGEFVECWISAMTKA